MILMTQAWFQWWWPSPGTRCGWLGSVLASVLLHVCYRREPSCDFMVCILSISVLLEVSHLASTAFRSSSLLCWNAISAACSSCLQSNQEAEFWSKCVSEREEASASQKNSPGGHRINSCCLCFRRWKICPPSLDVTLHPVFWCHTTQVLLGLMFVAVLDAGLNKWLQNGSVTQSNAQATLHCLVQSGSKYISGMCHYYLVSYWRFLALGEFVQFHPVACFSQGQHLQPPVPVQPKYHLS